MRTAVTETRAKKSSLGCLGCLAVPSLALMSLFLLGLLWWLNPQWIDHHAVWRAPLVQDSGQWIAFHGDDEAMLEQLGLEAEPELVQPLVEAQEWQRFEFGQISTEYLSSEGAEIIEPNGLRLVIPARALSTDGTLTMTPMARLPENMSANFLGPIYDIRLGDEEHLQFRRKATLTLPYVPGLDPTDGQLVVWENGRWVPVSSRIDRDAHTIRGEISHASLWTVVSTAPLPAATGPVAIGAALWAATNGTARGALRSVAW